MKCQHRTCEFDTDGMIKSKSTVWDHLDMMSFHVQEVHPPKPTRPVPSIASGGRKPEKFPRPAVGIDKTRKRWDFQTPYRGCESCLYSLWPCPHNTNGDSSMVIINYNKLGQSYTKLISS